MDFDKILKQWDASQKQEANKKPLHQGSGKKANAPSLEEKAAARTQKASPQAAKPRLNPDDYLNHWMAIHGVPDKDEACDSGSEDRSAKIEEAERIRRMRPQASLDLHGKTASEADVLILDFLHSCSLSGLEKVLIVHGKGLHSTAEPVMADIVRRALEANSLAGSFGPAERNMGGRGATWVRIRKRDYFSR